MTGYFETSTPLGPDGRSGLYIAIRPERRRTLPTAVATERVLHACTLPLDPGVTWQLNYAVSFSSGTLRWPRRYGAPLDRVAGHLARRSAVDLGLSIWSKSDGHPPAGPITGLLIRIFPDPRQHLGEAVQD